MQRIDSRLLSPSALSLVVFATIATPASGQGGVPPGGPLPAPVDVIDELVAVHPASYPTVQAATPDGQWVISAEGGTLAFLRVGGANPSSVPFPPSQRLPFDALPNAPGQVKRVTVGSLGVVAADLELDPALDIDDEVAGVDDGSPGSAPHPEDDRLDIIYVAGGHQGLWAIEAHPTIGYDNVAVRIDNSGNLDHLTQVSRRFCTDVETVKIGGEWFLLGLFARKDQNLLRIYPLAEVHSIMDQARASASTPPDLGFETTGARSIYFKEHPYQGPDVVVGGERLTYGGAYAMSMAIDSDPDESDGVGDPLFGDPVDVYVAALSGGLFRFRLYADNSTTPPTITRFRTNGPVFGTGAGTGTGTPAPYDQVASTVGGVPVNASGLPAQWFRNHESRVRSRSYRFGELIRSDPPYFMDVEVQNNSEGHYVYCAMGHLGWLRFDLGAAPFDYGMPIDHLEGRPAIERDASTGAPIAQLEIVNPTKWRRRFELDEPTNSPFLEPFDLGDPSKRNGLHAWNLELTRIGTGASLRQALVVNYAREPWTKNAEIKGPGRVLDQTFQEIGGFDLTYVPIWRREGRNMLVVYDDVSPPGGLDPSVRYDSGLIYSKDVTGVDLSNHTQATAVGGRTLTVMPAQSPATTGSATNERIWILHTHVAFDSSGAQEEGNVCVSFVDTGPGTTNALTTYPAIVRDRTEMLGRYHFGASFADAGDGNVVMQGNNDYPIFPPAPVYSDGLETGAGSLESLAAPTVTIAPGEQDKRLDTGIQHDERCQFVIDLPGGGQEQWVIGDRTINGSSGTWYYFGQHSFDVSATGVPTVELENQWLLGRVNSRYGEDTHGYYRGITSHPVLDAYTTSTVGTSAWPQPPAGTPTDPSAIAETFLTASRIGSPDGVLVFGRDTMLNYLGLAPTGIGTPVPFREGPWRELADVLTGDPPSQMRSSDWTFTLNSHPEWNGLEYDSRGPGSPAVNPDFGHSQQLFGVYPDPPFPPAGDFAGRAAPHVIQPITEVASTYTFLPKVTTVAATAGGPDNTLLLATPCGYASCSPDLSTVLGDQLAIDPADPYPATGNPSWGQSYHHLPIDPGYNASGVWVSQFRRGFVSLWQISGAPAFPTYDPASPSTVLGVDPWSRARRATEPTPELLSPGGTQLLPERPAGSPDLPALFLEGDGTSAFGLQFVKLTDSIGIQRTLAVVAEFTGSVQVFDITEVLQNPYVEKIDVDPDFVWYAPVDPLDRRRPNVFDADADPLGDPGKANVYVACSRMGVHVLTLDVEHGFVSSAERIVTSGSAHSVSIRKSAQGTLLLVGDHFGGIRFYRRP